MHFWNPTLEVKPNYYSLILRIYYIHTIEKTKQKSWCTYFLFRFRLSKPPYESNNDASRVAGFLEARNAEMRRYLAEVDIWKSSWSVASELADFLVPLFTFTSFRSPTSVEGGDETLNISLIEEDMWGWRLLNNLLFISSLGTTSGSLKGSQYVSNNCAKEADSSSTRLVIRKKGLSTRLKKKRIKIKKIKHTRLHRKRRKPREQQKLWKILLEKRGVELLVILGP